LGPSALGAETLGGIGAVVGDLLVQPASAHGRRGARWHLPFLVSWPAGWTECELLNHPDVWPAMRGLRLAVALVSRGCGRR
jgi:hypothetical protein